MTKITLYADDADIERGFQVEDHSGFDEKGEDIVCAAVSILTINTINAIEKFTGDVPVIKRDDDAAVISCLFEKAPGEESRLLLKTFALGVRSISDSYKKHVKVRVRRYK
ncbi:MAG: ribosomal-processing cysteine protease Prp [Lachnospiraceae bacterium]|nr:ribosomal-processing cysteine protease Prp [Lachnospiraceae bacterium]